MLHGRRRYLTVSQFIAGAAEAGLVLKRRTVQEWCADGRLRTKPSHRPGERLQIVASELERVIEEKGRG